MKEGHDGDCTIYSALRNNRVEDGICTCGYGLQRLRESDPSEMYSEELQQKLAKEKSGNPRDLESTI